MISPTSRVVLNLEVTDVPKCDLFSAADPYLVVFMNGTKIGQTEKVENQASYRFAKTFEIDYHFEELQTLVFKVMDKDEASADDFLGSAEVTLGEVVCEGPRGCRVPVTTAKGNYPTFAVTARAEEVFEQSEFSADVEISGVSAKKVRGLFGGEMKLELVCLRSTEAGYIPSYVHKEKQRSRSGASWRVSASTSVLCAGDTQRSVRFSVRDVHKDGKITELGYVDATLAEAARMQALTLPIEGPFGGEICIRGAVINRAYSFVNHLQGGLRMSLAVAIDFTASNGPPNDPRSLHYCGQGPSLYEQTLVAVSNVLLAYDADGNVPALGFGAKLPNGQTSHCFSLANLDPMGANCEVHGIDGLVNAYRTALGNTQLYGPTNFASLIQNTANLARASQATETGGPREYRVLLILTDGAITDIRQTIDAIVKEAAPSPMSIIICGIGNADFSTMERLDGDEEGLRSSDGRLADADIVQFVAIRDVANDPMRLASELLAELPSQVEQYYARRSLAPLVAPVVSPQ